LKVPVVARARGRVERLALKGDVIGFDELRWRGLALYLGRRATGFVVVLDPVHAHMWRVRYPDGQLSDLLNLSRAKDAAVGLALAVLNGNEGPGNAR
jgi:hypothetical protein